MKNKMRHSRIFVLSLFTLLAVRVFGQEVQDVWQVPWITVGDSSRVSSKGEVVVTGTVRVKETGALVVGASVSAETFRYFDYSDNNGQYALSLPPGRYRIIVRHVGMKPVYLKLFVTSGDMFNIEMEEGRIALEELVITSRAVDSNIKEAVTGLSTFNVQEIKTLPTLMGEVDILKSLQLLPGVTSVGEGASGLNVRGGRTDHNLVMLNEVPLFNSSHALGFVSAFNQDVIRDFSLYKGNVPANFGGRASSVLEIRSRRGDFNKWIYQGGIGPVSGRLSVEGPLQKDKTSMLLSVRGSYIDWVLGLTEDPDVKRSSTSFYDAFMAVSHRFNKYNVADLTVYTSNDYFRFSQQFAYDWTNTIVNSKFTFATHRQFSPSLSLSYGRYNSTLINPGGFDASELNNVMNYFQMKATLNYVRGERHSAVAGIESIGYFPNDEQRVPAKMNTSLAGRAVDKDNGLETAIFINDDFEVSERISVSTGLRFSQFSHLGTDTVFHYQPGQPKSVNSITDTTYHSGFEAIKNFRGIEPRISVRVGLFKNHSIKTGYNRMRQYVHLISNSAAPTPVDLWQVSNGHILPQVADNYSVGYFINFDNNAWETSVEGFYKYISNLVEYKDFPDLYVNHHLETELLPGKGRAFGIEFYLRKIKGKWTGWTSYTYSRSRVQVTSSQESERINEGNWFPSNYDKPHAFSLVIDRKLRKKGAIAVICSFNSGRPFTAIESTYINEGTVIPIYSQRNQYRIPNYIRFDFSFTIGDIVRKLDDSLVFSIYNFTSRENAYSVYYIRPNPNIYGAKPYKLSVLGSAFPSITYNFRF
jgi:hypothetical protein